MFYALAVTLCLATLFLVLSIASVLCVPVARFLRGRAGSLSPALAANLLFAVRLLPLGLAFLVTVGFVLPAFVEFEPNSTSEGLSARLATLAIAGALVLTAMAVRGAHILWATYQTRMQWMARSEPIYVHGVKIPVRQVEGRSSLLAVTGILRPRIFIAREIVERLSKEELAAALAHEMAHVSSFDNLKQLLLRITRPPGFLKTFTLADAAWTSASEVAADQSALAAGATALDLSSALVKVGRIGRPNVLPQAVTASHLLPPACATSLEARVQRLQKALEQDALKKGPPPAEQTEVSGWRKRAFPMAVLVLLAYSLLVPTLLPAIHEVLELLVR